MVQRVRKHAGVLLMLAGMLLATTSVALATHDADGLPHGGNGSGRPYYGGQIQSNNYTYYVTERNTGMNNWQSATGRRFIDGWTTGETMTQYIVYSNSQQDTDLAKYFGVPSCQSNNQTYGTGNQRAFIYGHDWNLGPLNNDRRYSVICLNITAYGYSPGYDTANSTTRKRGMTHEMGHSLHLDHDTDGVMSTCWCYDINISEAYLVNLIYSSAP